MTRIQKIDTTDAMIFVFVTERPVTLAAVWRVEKRGRWIKTEGKWRV